MSDEKKPEAPRPPAPPQPRNPGMVTFTVDGREIVTRPGTNMIDAAATAGVEIPYYCYHPRLTVAANCRMCLVEASTAPGGKLVPACQTAIAEGMVVKTDTDKVRAQQKMVMEFLLLNHPVDCSICDQAGECKLQDYYMRYDFKASRLEGGKVLRNKRKVLGDLVVLDQERCVLCTRCVRFMDEVARAPQLGVFGRGSHEVVDVAPQYGKLDSNYSGNIVDICPVGALLNRDFRFRARAWFLSASPSVCTGCSRGCSTFVDFMGQDTYRYRPRENEAINKSWLCDQGRLSYKQLNQRRVVRAGVGRLEERRELAHGEAVAAVAAVLTPLKGAIPVGVSPTLSNEDLLATLAFVRDVLGTREFFLTGRPPGEADFFLMTADKNPSTTALRWIAAAYGMTVRPFAELEAGARDGTVKGVVLFGHEVPSGDFARLLAGLEVVVVVAQNHTAVTDAATHVLPRASHVEDEVSFTQLDGITQRGRRAYPPRGESQPGWKWAVDLARAMGSELSATSSREVFRTLAPAVPELKDFPWDRAAPLNQNRPGITTMASGSDGRPPGWREQGVPNLRGLSPKGR